MNEKSAPLAPVNLKTWLSEASAALSGAGIPSARLDAELLLAHVLKKNRTWLIAHNDEFLSDISQAELAKLITRRQTREPIAYLTGKKEFYGREFAVTSDVLIPRPETETLIDIIKTLPLLESPTIHDVGTGSGCIAITIALELPSSQVSASDISIEAVTIARKNATKLGASVSIRTDDIMKSHYTTGGLDVITANLPYVDSQWQTSPETAHEPSLALFALDHGLELIKKLIEQASTRLIENGYLLLEADPCQHAEIASYAKNHGFQLVEGRDYIIVLQKT